MRVVAIIFLTSKYFFMSRNVLVLLEMTHLPLDL